MTGINSLLHPWGARPSYTKMVIPKDHGRHGALMHGTLAHQRTTTDAPSITSLKPGCIAYQDQQNSFRNIANYLTWPPTNIFALSQKRWPKRQPRQIIRQGGAASSRSSKTRSSRLWSHQLYLQKRGDGARTKGEDATTKNDWQNTHPHHTTHHKCTTNNTVTKPHGKVGAGRHTPPWPKRFARMQIWTRLLDINKKLVCRSWYVLIGKLWEIEVWFLM